MDKRDIQEGNEYQKELEEEKNENAGKYKENIITDKQGNKFRIPYSTIKEVTFSGINKADFIDLEHAARLQYRLLLHDSILFAKVEFVKGTINIKYNPEGADNRKEKISLQGLIDMLAKEGVHVDKSNMQENDVDYVKEIYEYQYDPKVIREHPPYGYTMEEWQKMKPEYEKNKALGEAKKAENFRKFQEDYLEAHPELAKELGIEIKQKKKGLKEKLFGEESKEKGFWFHGM